jgi:hypothetical protein
MKKAATALLVAALALLPAHLRAQTVAGGYVGYHDDFDFGLGAFLSVPLSGLHEDMSFAADVGLYFPSDNRLVDRGYFEINANAVYRFHVDSDVVSPFALGGLNIARWSLDYDAEQSEVPDYDDTDLGINLGGGVTFLTDTGLQPSVGIKIELSGGDGFVIFGGIGFPVGGS